MSEDSRAPRSGFPANPDGFRLILDEAGQRGDIVLDRPPLNVISMTQREELKSAFETLDRNPVVRVIVVRSQGEHFSSGGDIQGFLEQTPEHVSRLAWNVSAPERCRKPVIAAIRGYCFGVGLELALACDFRIVTESARLALPEQRIGMIPGSGGSARLVKCIGIARTKDMVMRARRITGAEARDWGLAVSLVADDGLEDAVSSLVDELRGFSPLAQRTAKHVIDSAQRLPLGGAIELEGEAYGRLRGSDDFREGVESFKAKRKPRFRGT
jgi:2-oxoglutaroyl-CoA hydrolase